jgi:hypothetical protein
MGRPKLKDSKKKVQVSISVPKGIADLAESTGNRSHFYATSVECSRALSAALRALRESRVTVDECVANLSDVAAIWNAEFDESVPFETPASDAKMKTRGKAKARPLAAAARLRGRT